MTLNEEQVGNILILWGVPVAAAILAVGPRPSPATS